MRTTPPQAIQSIDFPNGLTTNIPAWRPSHRLQKKINQLFNDHYNQFLVFLAYIVENYCIQKKLFGSCKKIYQLTLYLSISLDDIARTGTVNRLPTCRSCKKPSTRLQ